MGPRATLGCKRDCKAEHHALAFQWFILSSATSLKRSFRELNTKGVMHSYRRLRPVAAGEYFGARSPPLYRTTNTLECGRVCLSCNIWSSAGASLGGAV